MPDLAQGEARCLGTGMLCRLASRLCCVDMPRTRQTGIGFQRAVLLEFATQGQSAGNGNVAKP